MATLCTGLGATGWKSVRVAPTRPRESSTPCCPVPPWAFTCHDGFPVPFPIWPNSDELLPQERGHIRVAIHKYPDGVLQGDRSQIFDLPGTKTGCSLTWHDAEQETSPCSPQAMPSSPARGPRCCLLHSPRQGESPRPTSSVIVAEKSIVWRCWEHMRMISCICSSKYSSSILGSREGKESGDMG